MLLLVSFIPESVQPYCEKMGENAPKYVVKNVDMSDEMQQDAFTISNTALQEFNIEKDIAAYIKKEFDKKHGPTWHCIVGEITVVM
ncbi:Dynein light chain 1 cytoplasmic [Fasciola gigantica]|uniref:Dynein light chain n=1 Tax=Fasciola gigantica TaxID=46835 RepID=A0A504Z3C1_FASGI|nr:Dynein light chain 1 cytoplasmic [Fasciola gigantica]